MLFPASNIRDVGNKGMGTKLVRIRNKKHRGLELKVLELKAQDYNVRESAEKLGVTTRQIHGRLDYINRAVRDDLLNSLVYDVIQTMSILRSINDS
jgi:hypothetical protein